MSELPDPRVKTEGASSAASWVMMAGELKVEPGGATVAAPQLPVEAMYQKFKSASPPARTNTEGAPSGCRMTEGLASTPSLAMVAEFQVPLSYQSLTRVPAG